MKNGSVTAACVADRRRSCGVMAAIINVGDINISREWRERSVDGIGLLVSMKWQNNKLALRNAADNHGKKLFYAETW
jgi:hypothetical protein